LRIGEPILPFLEELREHGDAGLAARAEELSQELRFSDLRRQFVALAKAPEPDLERGALLLARFGHPGLAPAAYTLWLDRVASRVLEDLPGNADATTAFQRLNCHLFQSLGFSGNELRYYDPDNSYLNRVIDTRRGIPVSLSVLYLLLAGRLRLPVYGVATPGHFLVGFRPGPHVCYLDAYHKGRLLDLNEVRRMLLRSGYEFRQEYVARCSTRDILVRMMRNLISIYEKTGSRDRAEMLAKLVETLLAERPASRPNPA
ncbi:MAG: transglutaminase family protein, partial [Elusimicrobia bacterium]|nr:transglutaminase family protein [Elusimicrobiota bacterium]